ncbi:MAG: hypothetical protein GEV11_03500 [Streptosporangiales bacterium]|nr:hypothetical protein [Streptosporangiales bacterium]
MSNSSRAAAIELAVAYAERSPRVAELVAALPPDQAERVASELKTLSAFLTLRFAEAGLKITPEQAREAIAHRVAGLLEPEYELAVLTALDEAGPDDPRGAADTTTVLHLLGAYTAALTAQLVPSADLVPTLRALDDLPE